MVSDTHAKFPLDDYYGGLNAQIGESLFDPAWPAMREWAQAGVQGGIPHLPVVQEVASGSDQATIQRAIDAAAEGGGGAVLLANGHYVLRETLHLRDGVVLRGGYLDSVKLEICMRDTFPRFGADFYPEIAGIHFFGIQDAGLEHVTVVFDESLPRPLDLRHLEPPFEDNPRGVDDLFVQSVLIESSQGCWVEGCRVIDSGSTNIALVRSQHCTVRQCEIVGGHNRGGGHSYFNISRSSHCLVAGCVVKDIRHLSIQNAEPEHPCRYNVVIDCDLEVDINYHNGDSGHNLVESCRITIPSWHWWGPFAIGVKGGHQPPGPDNLIFACDAQRRRFGVLQRSVDAPGVEKVYRMADDWSRPLVVEAGPAPQGGTLYAVVLPED